MEIEKVEAVSAAFEQLLNGGSSPINSQSIPVNSNELKLTVDFTVAFNGYQRVKFGVVIRYLRMKTRRKLTKAANIHSKVINVQRRFVVELDSRPSVNNFNRMDTQHASGWPVII